MSRSGFMYPMNDLVRRAAGRPLLLGLLGLTLLGALLRAFHLDVPMRYDEAHTFMEYVRNGWLAVTSEYAHPNNHVLHSLLVVVSTSLFGSGPVAIRLPAFVAGCAVPALAGLLAWRHGGRGAALLAAGVTAGWPVLVLYSTNARGYSLVSLLVLAASLWALEMRGGSGAGREPGRSPAGHPGAGRGGWRWMALAAAIAAGLYTIPIALLPGLGIVAFLGHGALRSGAEGRRELGRLALLVAAVVALGLYLYLPILLAEGPDALVSNRFVAGGGAAGPVRPPAELPGALPATVAAVATHWARGVPLPLVIAVGLALAAELVGPGGRRPPTRLLLAMGLVSLPFALLFRASGTERTWLWMLPLALTSAALGGAALIERLPRGAAVAATAVPVLVAGWLGVHVLVGGSVRQAMETGAYADGPAVAAYLAPLRRPEDLIVTDFVTWGPLEYYLLHRIPSTSPPPPPPPRPPRTWVVLNRAEASREAYVRDALAEEGVRIEDAELVEEIGRTRVYILPWRPRGR